MSLERVLFAFVIVLALTLNVGFVVGDIDNPDHHDSMELFLAIVVSLVATVMKFGDRSPVGSTLLATSLVADVQLLAAAGVWGWALTQLPAGADLPPKQMATVVSFAFGAMVANVISVVLLVIETANQRR
jgi:Ca2+/H+ antiporter, TMEM165/GDT1 family